MGVSFMNVAATEMDGLCCRERAMQGVAHPGRRGGGRCRLSPDASFVACCGPVAGSRRPWQRSISGASAARPISRRSHTLF